MPIRQRVVTYGVSTAAFATLTVAALLQPWRGEAPTQIEPGWLAVPAVPAVPPAEKHAIDVVFALDTTGSMGGLLDGAKRTVWSIASHIRDADPNAELRVGLVAYRDIGDDYVTRDFALNGNLDAVFAELSTYQAAGGGDTPENVDAALDDALHKMAWRDGAKKLVFVVGDAPPASRGDVPRFDVLAREAGERQIILNTIRCGWDRNTETAWKQIAALGGGQFSSIQQDGGVQQVATPYDDKLAELSGRIDSTTVVIGGEGERAAYGHAMAVAAAAPAPAKADRAAYYAKKKGGRVAKDLVDDVESGAVDVAKLAASELPADLRALDAPALKAEIAKRAKIRKEAAAELGELTRKREEYLSKHAKGDGFDAKVKATLDEQLKR